MGIFSGRERMEAGVERRGEAWQGGRRGGRGEGRREKRRKEGGKGREGGVGSWEEKDERRMKEKG